MTSTLGCQRRSVGLVLGYENVIIFLRTPAIAPAFDGTPCWMTNLLAHNDSPASLHRRRTQSRIAALYASAVALFPSEAAAQPPGDDMVVGVGAFAGVAWGTRTKHKVDVIWGLRANTMFPWWAAEIQLGPSLQVAAIGVHTFQISPAMRAVTGTDCPPFAFATELGPVGFLGQDRGLAARLALQIGAGQALHTSAGAETYWGAGTSAAMLGSHFRIGCAMFGTVDGRRYRDANGGYEVGRSRGKPVVTANLRQHAGRQWADAAQAECDSIPAFLQLATELAELNAPEELTQRACHAAADEIRHAQLATALAQRYLGRAFRPAVPRGTRRPRIDASASLRRLAVEAWVDGAVGEGCAAEEAKLAARHCSDTATNAALRIIAHDEGKHAHLAWDVLEWAVSRRDATVSDALTEHAARLGVQARPDARHEPAAAHHLAKFGRLTAAQRWAVQNEVACGARRRLGELT